MNTPLTQNQIERLAETMYYLAWTQELMDYCENYLPKNWECFHTANLKRWGEYCLFCDLFGEDNVLNARETGTVKTVIEEAKAEARSDSTSSKICRLTGIVE